MGREQMNADMQAKLLQLGLPAEKVQVFGRIRLNVHVTCVGRDTADKWALALGQIAKGAHIALVPHRWEAKENKGTCLRPTMRDGFLIALSA